MTSPKLLKFHIKMISICMVFYHCQCKWKLHLHSKFPYKWNSFLYEIFVQMDWTRGFGNWKFGGKFPWPNHDFLNDFVSCSLTRSIKLEFTLPIRDQKADYIWNFTTALATREHKQFWNLNQGWALWKFNIIFRWLLS